MEESVRETARGQNASDARPPRRGWRRPLMRRRWTRTPAAKDLGRMTSRTDLRHCEKGAREKLRPRCAHRSGTGAPNGQQPKNRPKHSRASYFGWSLAQPSAAASRQGGRMRLGQELAFALTDPPQSLTLTRSPRRRLKKGSAAILERATRWPQTCSQIQRHVPRVHPPRALGRVQTDSPPRSTTPETTAMGPTAFGAARAAKTLGARSSSRGRAHRTEASGQPWSLLASETDATVRSWIKAGTLAASRRAHRP
jgi:hypothetical protein